MNRIIKTWKIVSNSDGKFPFFLLFYASINAIEPFIVLHFSSEIINQLYGGFGAKYMLTLLTIYVSIILIFEFVRRMLERYKSVGILKLKHSREAELCEKCYDMDYQKLEDEKVQNCLASIRQSKFQMGDIFEKEARFLESFFKTTIGLSVSIFYIISFASIISEKKEKVSGILASPLFVVILCLLLLGVVVVSAKNGMKHSENIYKRFVEIAPINRIFGFYRKNVFQNYQYGKEIRIFNEEKLIHSEFDQTLDATQKFMEKIGKDEGRYRGLNTFLSTLVSGSMYIVIALYAYYGVIGVGSIVKYIGVIGQLMNELTNLISTIANLHGNEKFVKQYFEFLNLEEQTEQKGKLLPERAVKEGEYLEIEFHNVVFQYPNATEPVLKGLSFQIKSREHIAIVGLNGSGKTTCIRLLCRFYKPKEGYITLNGKNIWDYDLEEYQKLLSVVFQDYKLFSIPLDENVSAIQEAEEAEIEEALKKADVWKRVQQMKEGIKTYLYQDFDSDGIEVSVGEGQKIAIAKALYKDSPLYILDEPTAALDPMAEASIYKDLQETLQKKTVIYISHRLSSCIFCDRVFVLENGKMLESGSHNELLKYKGKYEKLWNAQAQYYQMQEERVLCGE